VLKVYKVQQDLLARKVSKVRKARKVCKVQPGS
jgi:hypothetical protein